MEKFFETMNQTREEMFAELHTPKDKILSPEAEEDF